MGIRIPTSLPAKAPSLPDSIIVDSALWLNVIPCAQTVPPYQSAGQVLDLSAYANPGSSYQVLVGPGGLVFDNVDDRISFGTNIVNPRLAGARGLSAAVLVRPLGLASGAGRNQLFGFNLNGSLSCISAWFTDSGRLTFGGRSQAADTFQFCTTPTAVAADGVDIFVCGVIDYSNDRLRLWVGERLVAEQTMSFGSDTYQPGVSTLVDTIGATASGTYPLNGIIKGFALFRKPLDPGEISKVRELMMN